MFTRARLVSFVLSTIKTFRGNIRHGHVQKQRMKNNMNPKNKSSTFSNIHRCCDLHKGYFHISIVARRRLPMRQQQHHARIIALIFLKRLKGTGGRIGFTPLQVKGPFCVFKLSVGQLYLLDLSSAGLDRAAFTDHGCCKCKFTSICSGTEA